MGSDPARADLRGVPSSSDEAERVEDLDIRPPDLSSSSRPQSLDSFDSLLLAAGCAFARLEAVLLPGDVVLDVVERARGMSSSSSSESNMILRRLWISRALTLGVDRGAELMKDEGFCPAAGVFSGARGTGPAAGAAARGLRETYSSSDCDPTA